VIGETMAPLNPQPGQIAKEHYAYTKNGSCCLLAAIEPLTGARLAHLYERRTKREYALFMQALAHRYPEAIQIRVVQDNLNTHDLNTHDVSAFYETFSPAEAFALSQRFEFYFTPKSASWLNMIEIEFSALSRQCLKRRIPTREQMEQELSALVQERQDKGIRINWQFSLQSARAKFERHYRAIQKNNET
jgi:hypothetical protein